MLSKYKTYQDWKQHDPNPISLNDTGIRRLGTASNFVAHKPDPHAAKIANNPHAHTWTTLYICTALRVDPPQIRK